MFSNAKFSLLSLVFFLSSCATYSMLPKSASEVNFSKKIQCKTGWSKYEGIKFFKGIDEKTCHLAGKAGLTYANFQIIKESFEKRLVFGEHGSTSRWDGNIVAGVYIKPENNGCLAKLIVEGFMNLGAGGEVVGQITPRNLKQDIFLGMREYLIANNKIFKVEKEIRKPSYLAEENRQQPSIQPPKEQTPQSGSGSGFFVSKMGHVITNAHVV